MILQSSVNVILSIISNAPNGYFWLSAAHLHQPQWQHPKAFWSWSYTAQTIFLLTCWKPK